MASFEIYQDKDNKKDNSSSDIPTRAKNAKQPLGFRNTNTIIQKENGNVPAPSVKGEQISREVEICKSDTNLDKAEEKPNQLLPVIEHFEAISISEEEVSDFMELDTTSISLPESVQFSPMSEDCSVMEKLDSDTDESVKKNHADEIKFPDRQPGFEGIQGYHEDILASSREAELRHRPKAHYMLHQDDISYKMRSILIDWLVSVTLDYYMTTETLYLAVSYIDRFLSKVAVLRPKLQLVGTTALFIACKYEEISTPRAREFIYITDDSYSRGELLSQERFMLKVLSFNLVTPTAYAFINMYASMCEDMTKTLKFLTLYISELSLLKGEPFLLYLPSLISSAALALARYTLGLEMWSPQLEKITTYNMKNLRTAVLALSNTLNSAKQLKTQAIQHKYSGERYENVAGIEVKELNNHQLDELCKAYDAK